MARRDSPVVPIWVDEPTAYEAAKEFLEVVMPRFADRISLFQGLEPLFHKSGIEDEIARARDHISRLRETLQRAHDEAIGTLRAFDCEQAARS